MEQKKIIIIGATSGIGASVASIYVQNGHRVGVTGRRMELLQSLKNELGENLLTACFDVRGNENVERVRELIGALGGMDLLIYNAGTGDVSKQPDWQIEETTIRTNVLGCAEIVTYAFNYFVAQGYGQIVFTTSVAALRGNSWAPAYSASKAFMRNYAEGLSMKAYKMKTRIVITEIRPGFLATKMAKGNKRFWVAPTGKAAAQMVAAIEKKKRVAYITRRWRIVGWIMARMPYFLYKRIG
jgi:short-subunit dehydrogenase